MGINVSQLTAILPKSLGKPSKFSAILDKKGVLNTSNGKVSVDISKAGFFTALKLKIGMALSNRYRNEFNDALQDKLLSRECREMSSIFKNEEDLDKVKEHIQEYLNSPLDMKSSKSGPINVFNAVTHFNSAARIAMEKLDYLNGIDENLLSDFFEQKKTDGKYEELQNLSLGALHLEVRNFAIAGNKEDKNYTLPESPLS